jgi:hypothetical protein
MPLTRNLRTLTSWNPLGHSRPVTGLLYLYLYLYLYLLPIIREYIMVVGKTIFWVEREVKERVVR